MQGGSGQQGRNPAGESPVMSIPQFGHVVIPRFVWSNGKADRGKLRSPDSGNPTVRDETGGLGKLGLRRRMRTHPAIERVGMVTLHLKEGAPQLYPDPMPLPCYVIMNNV